MKRKPPPEIWYEIHELLGPSETLGNVPRWEPCLRRGNVRQVYQERKRLAALRQFKRLPAGTRFRLVRVEQKVIGEVE